MEFCKNYGEKPGCLGTVDERYTMDFTDVKSGACIKWCARCGPEGHAIKVAVEKALAERPDFAKELETAIEAAERKKKSNVH